MKKRQKLLLLGSGGLSIGQAGEFDYSGTQAALSLEEDGFDVVIVNPNIATVQTNPKPGRRVYLYPVEPYWVERVIEAEKPDGLVAGFGGQTALNCAMKLDEMGILARHGVQNLGTPISVLRLTEDRELFAAKMIENGIPVPPSHAATTVDAAVQAAQEIGYPVIVRAAFALGGLGSGFASDDQELRALASRALAASPQILVERSLKGWKEVEYEVMRDGFENSITICNMENFDPLGVHTGDSIVIAPSQTLTDHEYQLLRSTALKIVGILGIVGECNVQYALDPMSRDFYVIEVNARLSRSSALASKATGYPIATIAAKVVTGKCLLDIKNPVNGMTSAFFEPALDYVAIKIPRWDLKKFRGVSREIGSTMKSIGEVMGIGRSFPEALQKAIRMVSEDGQGISSPRLASWDLDSEQLRAAIEVPNDARILQILDAIRSGVSPQAIHDLTEIDLWFLSELKGLVDVETEISRTFAEKGIATGPVSPGSWLKWKRAGFGDEQIAGLMQRTRPCSSQELMEQSLKVRKLRLQAGVKPRVKKIDTSAAEFPARSNYLFLTYWATADDSLELDRMQLCALVLGGGSYRIGSSVEFDWCAVSCLEELKRQGWRSVVINSNPETVSTDFSASDHLFFEELSLERILDIQDIELADGVVTAMGGQLPNRLSGPLAKAGVPLLGHSSESIDHAEDRGYFSGLLDDLQISQPRWTAALSRQEVESFVDQVGFPVLVRPSYVLSGSAMNVATDRDSLGRFLSEAKEVSPDHPVILSEYFVGAQEAELDGVSQSGRTLLAFVSEHIEDAGVHSGDATLVHPACALGKATQNKIREIGDKIVSGLKLNGPFNIQFLVRGDDIFVIECNARASRSFPFVSKINGVNLATWATRVMLSSSPIESPEPLPVPQHLGVKAAMFSFQRLQGADPVLGVEMASTGEVGCISQTREEAMLLALESTGIKPPKRAAYVSLGKPGRAAEILPVVDLLARLEIAIYANMETSQFLTAQGRISLPLSSPLERIRSGEIDFVVDVPENYSRTETEAGFAIRRAAVTHGQTLFTDPKKATIYLESLLARSLRPGIEPLLVCPDWKLEVHHA